MTREPTKASPGPFWLTPSTNHDDVDDDDADKKDEDENDKDGNGKTAKVATFTYPPRPAHSERLSFGFPEHAAAVAQGRPSQAQVETNSSRREGMSPSSNGDSPLSVGTMTGAASANVVRQFPLPNRDFTIEIPSPQLAASSNGVHSLKSPTSLKSARTPSFSREGILGSAQKARNLSQSSENRPEHVSNGHQTVHSDEGSINPLKRRNTDATVDYPRRRATIAVGVFFSVVLGLWK
jgi:hypothetical protein